MAEIRFVVWNVEWMNDLFLPNSEPAAFRPDGDEPSHHPKATVKKRREDLAGVVNELSPDVVVVVEGPNRASELQLFFDADVEGTWRAAVQPSRGQSQVVGVAVRVDRGRFRDPPFTQYDTNNLPAFGPFFVDTDDDEIQEQYAFERRPLYAEVRLAGGERFRLLGVHLKSKLVTGAFEWSQWWQRADANRRKILAQATQLRLRFLDPYLTDPETRAVPLLVCGDVNDGPGLDASEKRLFGSGIERLMGTIWRPELCLRNALFDTLGEADKADLDFSTLDTTRFQDPLFNRMWHQEWIDHLLYSQAPGPWVTDAAIHRKSADGRALWKRYPHASDHYPVVATLRL